MGLIAVTSLEGIHLGALLNSSGFGLFERVPIELKIVARPEEDIGRNAEEQGKRIETQEVSFVGRQVTDVAARKFGSSVNASNDKANAGKSQCEVQRLPSFTVPELLVSGKSFFVNSDVRKPVCFTRESRLTLGYQTGPRHRRKR